MFNIANHLKECRRCSRCKPRTKDYFAVRAGRESAACRTCERSADRRHYAENRSTIAARKRAARSANPERTVAWRRASYLRHRDAISARVVDKVRSDPRLRVRAAIRTRFNKLLRGVGGKNGSSWQQLVGYGAPELVAHIDALLTPPMTWANYGTYWVIDHCRPVASFDLPREMRECWALSNLRPLEKLENQRKGAKRVEEISHV